jgi:hypothetical protein
MDWSFGSLPAALPGLVPKFEFPDPAYTVIEDRFIDMDGEYFMAVLRQGAHRLLDGRDAHSPVLGQEVCSSGAVRGVCRELLCASGP